MGRHHRPDDVDRDPQRAAGDSGGDDRRRARGGAIIAFAAAFAILLGLGATGWVLLRSDGLCLGEDIRLDVAVAPEIAPAVAQTAAGYQDTDPSVDNRCVTVDVRAVDPADVTYGITGLGPTAGDTDSDVWIPDSSIWVNYITKNNGEESVQVTGTSIAVSPLVLAAPVPASSDGGQEPVPASWRAIVPTAPPGADPEGQDIRLIDPVQSSSGMATLALLNGIIQAQLGDTELESIAEGEAPPASPQFIAALQNLQENVSTDEDDAFTALATAGDNPDLLLPLAEQAVWRYNNEFSDAAVRVSYPEEGTYILDYPYVVRSAETDEARAAEQLRTYLTNAAAQATFRDHGFRSDDGQMELGLFDTEHGFQEEMPNALPTPSDSALATLTASWNQLKLKTRLLTLMDISGSMLAEVPGTGANRMQIATAAAAEGLQLFPDDAELGLWVFSENITPEGLDYREVHPITELGADVNGITQREALTGQLGNTDPIPTGDTGLYDTILAAYREMLSTYSPDRVSTILVLTDGDNEKDGGIELPELLETLEEESDPERPVQIIVISFGPEVSGEPMNDVVQVTGGSAYVTSDPTEIGDIFLEGFSLRLATAVAEETEAAEEE